MSPFYDAVVHWVGTVGRTIIGEHKQVPSYLGAAATKIRTPKSLSINERTSSSQIRTGSSEIRVSHRCNITFTRRSSVVIHASLLSETKQTRETHLLHQMVRKFGAEEVLGLWSEDYKIQVVLRAFEIRRMSAIRFEMWSS